jgi:hypothetical protein
VTFTCPSQRQLKEVRPAVLDRAIVLQDREEMPSFKALPAASWHAMARITRIKASGDDFQQCKTVT